MVMDGAEIREILSRLKIDHKREKNFIFVRGMRSGRGMFDEGKIVPRHHLDKGGVRKGILWQKVVAKLGQVHQKMPS
jgi:hypothetical protein